LTCWLAGWLAGWLLAGPDPRPPPANAAEEAAPTDFNAADDEGKLLWPDYPPTLFVVMERGYSRLDAPIIVNFFRKNGVPSDVIVVRWLGLGRR
jgi:hypothetical protein